MAKEIVGVWHYVCIDGDEWRQKSQDPITMLRGRLEYFGAVLTSPIQLTTSKGAANLDTVSGRKVEKLFAAVREERSCNLWREKINARWARAIGREDLH